MGIFESLDEPEPPPEPEKKNWLVTVKEIMYTSYLVEAHTKEEAKTEFFKGGGEYCDQECGETLTEDMVIEEW